MATGYRPRPARSRRTVGTTGKPKVTGNAKAMLIRANSAKPGSNPGRGFGPGTTRVPSTGSARPSVGAPVAAAARPAPAQRQPQPAAPDSLYNDQVDRLRRQEEQRLSELGQQESTVKREFGIEDPSDPFSRANALKQSFLARQKAASAGLASQGQLYSGAHERALTRTRREEEQARHELRQAYEGAINQIGSAKAGVKFATEEERAQAFEDWLARAPEAAEDPLTEEEIESGGESIQAEAASAAPAPPVAGVIRDNRPGNAVYPDIKGSSQYRDPFGAEAKIRAQRQTKRKTAAQKARDQRQAERQRKLSESTVGRTGPAKVVGGAAPKAGGGRQLRSYVKNGWFYREDSRKPGKFNRIRRASGR